MTVTPATLRHCSMPGACVHRWPGGSDFLLRPRFPARCGWMAETLVAGEHRCSNNPFDDVNSKLSALHAWHAP